MTRRLRAYRSAGSTRPQNLQADMYALAHRLSGRAEKKNADGLTVEQLRDLAIERGLTDVEIVASHGRLLALGHGAVFRSEIVCAADIERLLVCRRPQSCPIDGEQARRRQTAGVA